MKKHLSIFIALVIGAIAFTSCQSKESKAENVINTFFKESMYDYDSYQVISTEVTGEAKASPLRDTTAINMANRMRFDLEGWTVIARNIIMYNVEYDWSVSQAENDYYNQEVEWVNEKSKALGDYIDNFDTTKVVGWSAVHKFRCKDKNGKYRIAEYTFVIDSDFKKILYVKNNKYGSETTDIIGENTLEYNYGIGDILYKYTYDNYRIHLNKWGEDSISTVKELLDYTTLISKSNPMLY